MALMPGPRRSAELATVNLAADPGGGGATVHPIRHGHGFHHRLAWPISRRAVRLRSTSS